MGEIDRGLTVEDFYKMNFDSVDISNEFRPLLGDVDLKGIWLIYGGSAHGKTSFSLQLIKELVRHGRVAYNPLEEGATKTFKKALIRNNMAGVTNFIILRREPIDQLKIRLRKQRSPQIVFTDSIQYTGLRKADIIQLQNEFPNKLFVFISHADGKKPSGKVAQWLYYHSDITIRVDRFVAHPVKNRFEGTESYVIWKDGADIV
jgi:hypothetical protein